MVPSDAGRNILWRRRRPLFVLSLLLVSAIAAVSFVVLNIELPPVEPLRQTTFVCTIDVGNGCGPENAMASFSAEEDRVYEQLEEIPDVVVGAVLASEDRDFFDHQGIDPIGIVRALYADLRNEGATQGGSTITQQYVKTVFLSSERTVTRKLKEAVLAMKLERELSKEEILERYLNTIYFGRGAYGVGAAARAYFDKDLAQVGPGEAAYLAGLIRAPESADAERDPEEATRRRNTGLVAMQETGMISAEERAAAEAIPIQDLTVDRSEQTGGFGAVSPEGIGAEYYVDWVQRELIAKYGEDVVYGGGLRVYTTIDPRMQQAAWEAVNSTLDAPDDPAAALVAVDDQGYVRAMVGGRDFANQKVNLALGARAGGSGRGAGSAFKPIVLTQAVAQGISIESKFNSPAELDVRGRQCRRGLGRRQLRRHRAGHPLPRRCHPRLVQHRLLAAHARGRARQRRGDGQAAGHRDGAASGELAGAGLRRRVRARHGERLQHLGQPWSAQSADLHRPRRAGRRGGQRHSPRTARPGGEQVIPPEVADTVTYCLRQVVLGGTGSSAEFGKPIAGKTGTTQDNRDAWFVGYTPKLTAAVWMGYPGTETRYMDDVHGHRGHRRHLSGGDLAQVHERGYRRHRHGLVRGARQPRLRRGPQREPHDDDRAT